MQYEIYYMLQNKSLVNIHHNYSILKLLKSSNLSFNYPINLTEFMQDKDQYLIKQHYDEIQTSMAK